MSAMPWMELAWNDIGTAEVAGAQHNPKVVQYFAEVGRADVHDDETAWCAAFAGACLVKSGIAIHPDKNRRLLARSFLEVGTEITEPRVGALCILKRGSDPAAGHVGFVLSWTDTMVRLIGGNQSNKVCEANYARSEVLGFRWPTDDTAIADILSGSRKWFVMSWASRVLGIGGVGGGISVYSAENVSATRSYAQAVKGFVTEFGVEGFIIFCLLGFFASEIVKGFMKNDVATGRATPSGTTSGKATP